MRLNGSDTKTISSDHTLAHVFDFDYRENKVVHKKFKGNGILKLMNKNSRTKYVSFQEGTFFCCNLILSYVVWPLIIFIRDFLSSENKQ